MSKKKRDQKYHQYSQQPTGNYFFSSNMLAGLGMILGTALILVLGVTWISKSGQDNKSAAQEKTSGKLTIAENDFELGEISMKNGNVYREYQLSNNSQEPVTITKMNTSCMCTKAQLKEGEETLTGWAGMSGHSTGTLYPNQTVNPGETVTVVANFDPNAHGPDATGPIHRTVNIQTNSKTNSTLSLNFSGNVIK